MFGDILKGKTAIVTGGAIGIGEACIRHFAGRGADAVIVDINDERAENIVKDLSGQNVYYHAVDVTDEKQVSDMVKQVYQKFGKIDILVNCAGFTTLVGPTLVEDTDKSEWDRMMNVNLTGTFLMMKHVVPYMKKARYGRIVSISTIVILGAGYKGGSPYAASKAGMVGLTKMVAREAAPFGITVNAIAPGPTKTPTRQILIDNEEEIAKTVPLGILAEAEDIANAIVFLSSDAARFITAHVLFVDGGTTIPWDIDEFLSLKSK